MAIPSVSVIVPCFNEEAGFSALLERLQLMRDSGGHDWEIIVVDDGSYDGTFARLLRASCDHSWLKVLRHQENLGLGAALKTGFSSTEAPIVCTIDSDCTYPPERLPELARLLEQEGVDLATASAWHPDSTAAEGNPIRIFLSRMVSEIYKFLIGQDVHTFTCLFRAYRRETLEEIHFRADGFASVAEIMLRAMLGGASVREVPMQLEERKFGESKLKVGDAIAAHILLLTITTTLVLRKRMTRVLNSINN